MTYGLDENTYADMATLGMSADRAGLMITSLENLPDGEGAELLLVGEGLGFAFAVEVRPATLKLFLAPVDGNAVRNRFRILGTKNTSNNWEGMTLAILRLGLRWKPRGEWQEALRSHPVEFGDLVVVVCT
jgi:hypothetical protein